jgi:hypothetical protein
MLESCQSTKQFQDCDRVTSAKASVFAQGRKAPVGATPLLRGYGEPRGAGALASTRGRVCSPENQVTKLSFLDYSRRRLLKPIVRIWQAIFVKVLSDYEGRPVRLTDERLAHVLEHPEMRGLESALEETLRHPTFVIESRTDSPARLNYRFHTGTRVGDKWLCVVVKYGLEDSFVVTAYLTDRPKRGRQVWPIK